MLSKQQFERTRRLALSLAGIELVERHRDLLQRRSGRLGITDSAGLDSLLNAAEKGEPTARQRFLRLLTTKFTGFFRQPNQFEIAAAHARRIALRTGTSRLWSAAAATGEEPYSLAIAAIEVFESDEPPVSLLATDVDVDALETAKRGEYREAALRGLAPERRERFFRETNPGAVWTIASAPQRLVEFRALNLTSSSGLLKGLST
jgi:chemotaxis protein methyltransferase CheR